MSLQTAANVSVTSSVNLPAFKVESTSLCFAFKNSIKSLSNSLILFTGTSLNKFLDPA